MDVRDVCAPGCLTCSLEGFGKGERRGMSLQVWMWAETAEEDILVVTFGAGPEGKTWVILGHP